MTTQLVLTELVAGQASAEVTVNEALRALDAVVQLSVKDRDLTAPPGSPAEGDRYVVAASGTGAWSGHDGQLAVYLGGAWKFWTLREGWTLWIDDENVFKAWNGSAFVDVAAGGGISDGDKGDVTVSGGGATWTIDAGVVTLAKMADLAQDAFIVRTTASTGVPETATCTAAARTILDDTTVAAMVDTLGGASSTGTGGLVRASGPTLTSPVVVTDITVPNTGLHVLDTNASHDLVIRPGSDLTADRTLQLTTGDASRELTINADTTLGGGAHSGTNTGDQTITLTGDVTGSGTGSFAASIAAGVIVDANVNAGAAIAHSKLSNVPLLVPFVARGDAQVTWTDMPAAEAFLFGSTRAVVKVDLTGFAECRLVLNKLGTVGASGSKLSLKYATTGPTTLGNYAAIGTSAVEVAVDVTDVNVSSWIALVSGAKADVFLAITGQGGDGVIDAQFGSIVAQFR
jgi:hypothetical protein